jgi:hypothetical protein
MAEYIKVNGVWKLLTAPYVKVAGAWKHASGIFVKSSGVWKSIGNPDTETTASPSSGLAGSSVTVSGNFSKVSITGVNFGGSPVTFTQTTSSVTFSVPSVGVGTYPIQLITGVTPELAPINFSVTGTGGGGIGVGIGVGVGIINTPNFGIINTPNFGIINTPHFGIIATPHFGIIATPYFRTINTPVIIATIIATPYFRTINTPVIIATPSFGGCWAVGSMVTLANGSKVAIETLKIGDEVLTADIPTYPNGEDSSKWYPTSVWSTDRVDTITQRTTKVVYNSQYTEPYYYIINGSYKLTWEHWMFIERDGLWQFQQMANLKVGDKLVDQSNTPVDIFKIEIKQEPIEVSMLDVEPNDLFYADGILTHNFRGSGKT